MYNEVGGIQYARKRPVLFVLSPLDYNIQRNTHVLDRLRCSTLLDIILVLVFIIRFEEKIETFI